jgi:transcriptional regulator with XRE-family HTH domain
MAYSLVALGQVIRDLRTAKGMTQDDLGSAAGYGAGAGVSISRIENGLTRPSDKRLPRIALVLGVTRAQLESAAEKQTTELPGPHEGTGGKAASPTSQKDLEDRANLIRPEIKRRQRVNGELLSAFHDAQDRAFSRFLDPLREIAREVEGAEESDPEKRRVAPIGAQEPDHASGLPPTPLGTADSFVKGANGVVVVMAPSVGRATSDVAYEVVKALGHASTRAPISGLHGVAQSNAVYSRFGLGTKASGGFGVVGGTKVLAGIKIGAAAVAVISPMVLAAMRSRKQQREYAKVLDELNAEFSASRRGVDALEDILPRATTVLDEIAVHGGRALGKWKAQLGPQPRTWDSLDPAQMERYQDFFKIADCADRLLDVVEISVPAVMESSGADRERLIELADTVLNQSVDVVGSLV